MCNTGSSRIWVKNPGHGHLGSAVTRNRCEMLLIVEERQSSFTFERRRRRGYDGEPSSVKEESKQLRINLARSAFREAKNVRLVSNDVLSSTENATYYLAGC
jgi:hypothetical protein